MKLTPNVRFRIALLAAVARQGREVRREVDGVDGDGPLTVPRLVIGVTRRVLEVSRWIVHRFLLIR